MPDPFLLNADVIALKLCNYGSALLVRELADDEKTVLGLRMIKAGSQPDGDAEPYIDFKPEKKERSD